jgi:sec-independent protein translocase protein TatC
MLKKFISRKSKTATPNDADSTNPAGEMSFLDHLEELRWHIVRSLAWILVTSVAAFIAKDFIFGKIIFAPRYPDFLSYRVLCDLAKSIGMAEALCFSPPDFEVQAVGFGELFTSHIKVSFFVGLLTAIPLIFWEVWRFIKPGLYDKERNAASGFVGICSLLFMVGVLFGYYVIAPFAVTFLSGYEIVGAKSAPTLDSYVNYMVMFTIPVGLIFELPILVYLLSKIGIVTPEFMRTYRRHAIIIILLVAAIVTPPDVMTQMLVGIPLIMLYEISILVSARVVKKQKLEADD